MTRIALLLALSACSPSRYVLAGDVWSGTGSCECEHRIGHVLCLSECSREECMVCRPAKMERYGGDYRVSIEQTPSDSLSRIGSTD